MIKAVLAFVLLFLPVPALCHPGGLDVEGGHYNRRTGEYHYHGGHRSLTSVATLQSESSNIPRSETLSEAEKERKIGAYFRQANEGVGALQCAQTIHARDVSPAEKATVLARDGHRCLICGSSHKLEVDHMRALMNGGDNSDANLATLCDDCHKAKTKMDNALRRKREKLCRR